MSIINRVFRRSSALAGALALTIGAALVPASALAATPITFGHEGADGILLRDHCVFGHAAASSDGTLTWRSSNGTLKVNTPIETSDFGTFSYCDPTAVLKIGDVLKLNDSHSVRYLTVPRLTLKVDRVNNEFRGFAPANSNLTVWSHWAFSDFYSSEDVVANSDGRWVLDEDNDVHGGTNSYLDWHSPKGDIVTVHSGSPEIDVIVGRSDFAGFATPGSTFKVTLRDGLTDAIKGTSTSVADEYGSVSGQFRGPNGHAVAVAVGDRVVGRKLATDLDWIVSDASAIGDVPSDNGVGHLRKRRQSRGDGGHQNTA